MLDTSNILDRTEERPITVYAFLQSFIISALFVGIITVVGELATDSGGDKFVKSWLADTHGHHWVGKGIWTLILFGVFSFIGYLSLKIKSKATPAMLVRWAGHVAALVSLAILVFFIYEYNIAH